MSELNHSLLGAAWKSHKYTKKVIENGKVRYIYDDGRRQATDNSKVNDTNISVKRTQSKSFPGLSKIMPTRVKVGADARVDLRENTKWASELEQEAKQKKQNAAVKEKIRNPKATVTTSATSFYDQYSGEPISKLAVNATAARNRAAKYLKNKLGIELVDSKNAIEYSREGAHRSNIDRIKKQNEAAEKVEEPKVAEESTRESRVAAASKAAELGKQKYAARKRYNDKQEALKRELANEIANANAEAKKNAENLENARKRYNDKQEALKRETANEASNASAEAKKNAENLENARKRYNDKQEALKRETANEASNASAEAKKNAENLEIARQRYVSSKDKQEALKRETANEQAASSQTAKKKFVYGGSKNFTNGVGRQQQRYTNGMAVKLPTNGLMFATDKEKIEFFNKNKKIKGTKV